MAETASAPLGDRLHDEFVVDGDFHLHVPVDELYPYVRDEAIRRKLERFGDPPRPVSGWSLQYATETAEKDAGKHMRPHGIAVNAQEVLEVRDRLGVDRTVVTPGTNLSFTGGARYPVVLNQLARAYNDYVLDEVVDPGSDIYAAFVLPAWDVEFALEEIDRIGDEAAFVAAQNYYSCNRPFGDTRFDRVYEALTRLGLPLALHIGDGARRFDLLSDGQHTHAELGAVELNHSALANVANMIMTGVFDAHPDLTVVLQESGTAWVPYVAYGLDQYYQSGAEDVKLVPRLYDRGQDYLGRMPSEYFFDHFYLTTQPIALPDRSDQAEGLLAACRAADLFVFSTDWPHITMDTPDWLFERIHDADVRARITHENATDAFRFPDDD